MKKSNDVYGEPQIFEFPGMIARVYRPILTEEERARRMKIIERAAAELYLDTMRRVKEKEEREKKEQTG